MSRELWKLLLNARAPAGDGGDGGDGGDDDGFGGYGVEPGNPASADPDGGNAPGADYGDAGGDVGGNQDTILGVPVADIVPAALTALVPGVGTVMSLGRAMAGLAHERGWSVEYDFPGAVDDPGGPAAGAAQGTPRRVQPAGPGSDFRRGPAGTLLPTQSYIDRTLDTFRPPPTLSPPTLSPPRRNRQAAEDARRALVRLASQARTARRTDRTGGRLGGSGSLGGGSVYRPGLSGR